MTRLLFTGGQVFDGSGAAAASADLVVEAGRIVEVGTGLDGDEQVDARGRLAGVRVHDAHLPTAPRRPSGIVDGPAGVFPLST